MNSRELWMEDSVIILKMARLSLDRILTVVFFPLLLL